MQDDILLGRIREAKKELLPLTYNEIALKLKSQRLARTTYPNGNIIVRKGLTIRKLELPKCLSEITKLKIRCQKKPKLSLKS